MMTEVENSDQFKVDRGEVCNFFVDYTNCDVWELFGGNIPEKFTVLKIQERVREMVLETTGLKADQIKLHFGRFRPTHDVSVIGEGISVIKLDSSEVKTYVSRGDIAEIRKNGVVIKTFHPIEK